MKPDKLDSELATIQQMMKRQDHMSLQKIAQHNLPLFICSMGGLAAGLVFTMYAVLTMATKMTIATSGFFMFVAGACISFGLAIVLFTLLFFGPKGVMAKNYSKAMENEDLSTLSVEQLNTLIEFHRFHKNLEAADRASKFLVLKVDSEEEEETK